LSVWFGSNQCRPRSRRCPCHSHCAARCGHGRCARPIGPEQTRIPRPITPARLGLRASVNHRRALYVSVARPVPRLAGHLRFALRRLRRLPGLGRRRLKNWQEFTSAFAQGGMCRNMGLTARWNPLLIRGMHPRPCDRRTFCLSCYAAVPGARTVTGCYRETVDASP